MHCEWPLSCRNIKTLPRLVLVEYEYDSNMTDLDYAVWRNHIKSMKYLEEATNVSTSNCFQGYERMLELQ